MITLENIGVILSNNGNIYLSAYKRSDSDQIPTNFNEIDQETHQKISKIANILRTLSIEGL